MRALRRLGRDTVETMVWPVSEAEALLVDRANRQSSAPSALKHGWLLHELSERHGLSGEDLSRRLGRSASWVSRHLGLVRELPAAVQEHVRAGRLAGQAVMKYLLPLYRARAQDAEAMVAAAVRLQLVSCYRNMLDKYYALWSNGGHENRTPQDRTRAQPGGA